MSTKTTTPHLPIVIVGHVDHGKSTLIGRLLYDTDSLPDGKYEELQAICKRRGTDALEWSFVLDAFQAERDQAITIDTTQIWFNTAQRNYVIIDAPGHREFLKNMVSGAASADAAILVVDAAEGVREQTKRHAYLLSLLGLKQITVVINKMDMVGHDAACFSEVSEEVETYLDSLGLQALNIIPISARHGDMIATRGENLSWYSGKTLLEALDRFESAAQSTALPLRFPIQDVYRHDEKRILVGRIESGALSKGDKILLSPTNEEATITSIEIWPPQSAKIEARAGECIGITLDQPVFAERGHMISHAEHAPMLSNVLKINCFWLSSKALKVGGLYKIRINTREIVATVQSINKVIDTDSLAQNKSPESVERNQVAEITVRCKDMIPLDPYSANHKTGKAVIYDSYDIVGGGLINMDGYSDQRMGTTPVAENLHKVGHLLAAQNRAERRGHYGGIFWFTGLSGAGKSTLAMAVEKALFEKGFDTYVLDGDNVRHGLNADLGFSPDDRTENIRRIGEVAALMSDAGLIVLTAFISPYVSDRDRARRAAPDLFHEIYVKADLNTCESRDPKGLYKKARAGDIKQFTGIDSPYEPPVNPELVVDTQAHNIQTCVEQITAYIIEQTQLRSNAKGSPARASA